MAQLIYPHIHDILTEMCDEEKENMKKIDNNVLGSWQRGVVTSDGVWHTRGHFSKNGSFIVKNYLTGGLLWFGHKCMRGNSEDDDLFMGTAKSMEGILAGECYRQAKDEGCNIEVVGMMAIQVPRSLLKRFLELSPGGCLSVGVMLEGLTRTV